MDKFLFVSNENIDSFFKAATSSYALYLPVKNASGQSEFARYEDGVKMSDDLNTVRSAKDFFFPQVENLASFKRDGLHVEAKRAPLDDEDFAVFGVRACDAASFNALDRVFMQIKPEDTYYKSRREHSTIITLACNADKMANECFCKLWKIDPANPAGDVQAWQTSEGYTLQPLTDKGATFVEKVASALKDATDAQKASVETLKKEISERASKQAFANEKLEHFTGKNMMKVFNLPIWENLSETCLACGSCTFVCPTCQCYDIRDFSVGTATGSKVERFRCWDSCMYSDFTKMAAANPRTTHAQRFRQRFMHKLMYYPMDYDGAFGCVGCGRCLKKCPQKLNIVKVMRAINQAMDSGEAK